MARVISITGVDQVARRMSRVPGMRKKFERGLIRAGLFIQRESQLIVPVATGNLKSGSFTKSEGHGFYTEVAVGYRAAYAIYVHERTDLRHAPGKQAKFLEEPIKRNRKRILQIVQGKMAEGGT